MHNTRVKILYFIPGFYYGGIETFAVTMMEQFDRSCFQIDLLKHENNPDKTPLLHRVRSLGGEVYNLPPFRITHIFSYIKATYIFLKSHSDYQAIHCHSLVHSFFLLLFASMFSIPVRILHSHTSHSDEGWLHRLMGNFFRYLSLPLSTAFVACSDKAAIWGFGKSNYLKDKVKIVHNGIQLSDFKFKSEDRNRIRSEYQITDKIVIGHVGRLTTAKNGRFLLDVIKAAVSKDPRVVLMQIGDGPDLDALKQYVQELGIANHVLFMGRKNNVSAYYSAFDVFFLPSLWEGAPLCAIEAQANGLPCVLSDVITREVEVCEGVLFISLEAPLSTWVEALLDIYMNRNISTKAIQTLTEVGYDYKSSVKTLEQLYTQVK